MCLDFYMHYASPVKQKQTFRPLQQSFVSLLVTNLAFLPTTHSREVACMRRTRPMEHPDNLVDFYLLTLVVEADGFSAAARRAGTTKSRLSRRIIQLERRLGMQLLHRNARHFSITPVGKKVYRQALLIREATEAAERLARNAQSASDGHVRVHSNSLLLPLMENMLGGFRQHHPHMQLHAIQSENGMDALLAQQTDVVLHMTNTLPDSADIVAHKLGAVYMVTVVSPDLLMQTGLSGSPEQVPEQFHLNYVSTTSAHSHHNLAPMTSPAGFTSNHAPTLLAAARAGMGYAKLPLHLCQNDLRRGALVTPFVTRETSPVPLHALTLQERATSKAIRSFLRFIRGHLSQLPVPAG